MSSSRRLLLVALMIALTLGAIEIGARCMEWASARFVDQTHPFVDAQNPVPVFEEATVDGVRVMRRTRHHPLMLPGLSFAAEKPPNGFRVFLLGGSAAGGWPYDLGGFSIADHLRKKLEILYPGHAIDVINAAGGTYASHRVRFVFDEIIDYDPDLIVLYSGNNEFLENFVFRPQLPSGAWKHLAVARIVHRARLSREGAKPSFDVENYNLADQTTNRLSYAFGRASRYRRDPEQFRGVVENFRRNLDWMARVSAERDVPILFLDVPVNLKDWQPNASQHRDGLTGPERRRWQHAFGTGLLALESGDPATAADALAEAVAADDEHAETWYYLGRALHALGRSDDSREAFVKALERDAYPFRAIPPLWAVIDQVAERRDVPRVRASATLERLTADGILGAETLVDYVHLSEASQEVVAHEVLRTAAAYDLLPAPPGNRLATARTPVPQGFRPQMALREGEALYRQYLVMRQYDRIDEIYARYVDALTRAPQVRPDLADYCAKRVKLAKQIQGVLAPYRSLLHAEKLGGIENSYTREEARGIYQDYIRMIRVLEAPDMPQETFREFVPPLRFRRAPGPAAAPAPS